MKRSTTGPHSNDSKNAPITADFHKTLGSNFEEQRKQFYRKYYSKFQSARFERNIALASPGARTDLNLLVRYVNDEFDDESQVIHFVCEMNEWNENKLENFLEALLPNIGRQLIHKWNDFAKWPTKERGALVFRSPNNKVLVAKRQLDCLYDLIDIRGCFPEHISESVSSLVRLGGLFGFGTTSINGYGLLSSSNGEQYAIGTLAASAIDGNSKESAEVLSLIREIWQRKNSSIGVKGWHFAQALGRSNRGDLHDELVDRLVSQGCTFDSVRILRAGLDSSLEVMNRILPAAIKAGLHQHKSVRAAIIDAFCLSHPPMQKSPTLIEDCAAVLQKEDVQSTQKWYAQALEVLAGGRQQRLAIHLGQAAEPEAS